MTHSLDYTVGAIALLSVGVADRRDDGPASNDA